MIEQLIGGISPDTIKQQETRTHIVLSKEQLALILNQDQNNNKDLYVLELQKKVDTIGPSLDSSEAMSVNNSILSLGDSLDVTIGGNDYTLYLSDKLENNNDAHRGQLYITDKATNKTLLLEKGVPEINGLGRMMGGKKVKKLCAEGSTIERISQLEILEDNVIMQGYFINTDDEVEPFSISLERNFFDALFDQTLFVKDDTEKNPREGADLPFTRPVPESSRGAFRTITIPRDDIINNHIQEKINEKYGNTIGNLASKCLKSFTFHYKELPNRPQRQFHDSIHADNFDIFIMNTTTHEQ